MRPLCSNVVYCFSSIPNTNLNESRFDSNKHVPAAKTTPLLEISSPKKGEVETTNQVRIEIKVGAQAKAESLRLTLNGKNVSKRISVESCEADYCRVTGTVAEKDGVTTGTNMLRATVIGKKHGVIDAIRTRFDYLPSGSLGDTTTPTVAYYVPASVGLDITPNGGGGGTWVTISTGNQANVDDPVQNYPALPAPTPQDPNAVSPYTYVPYPDVQFPINCPGWTYQAMVLDRSNPTKQETATCVQHEADMESDFQSRMGRPLDERDLIIFGTTPGNFALSDLDTSGIGGTNYAKQWAANPNLNPTYYIIVGVKGATPGTARETYRAAGEGEPNTDTPYSYFQYWVEH